MASLNGNAPYLSVKQASIQLCVSEKTIYNYIRGGDLPAYKMGGRWRIKESELSDWASRNFRQEVGDEFDESDDIGVLDIREAAEWLQVCERTVYTYVREHNLPARKIMRQGRHWRWGISQEDLEAWVKSGGVGGSTFSPQQGINGNGSNNKEIGGK